MFWIFSIIGILFFGIISLGFYFYNLFVSLNQEIEEAWAGIEVLLKKRFDLIPNLNAIVKGYADYEKGTLEKVTKARQQSLNTSNLGEKFVSENQITQTLSQFFILSEKYPDLKANEQFQNLHKTLVELENAISRARRYYNGTVRKFNISKQSFPSLIVAKIMNLKEKQYFDVDSKEKQVSKIIL